MNKTERDHIERVKSSPCAACMKSPPCDAHHIREGQGGGQRAGHFLTIALCKECHQGPFSIHNSRRQFQNVYGSELSLLNKTISMISGLK